MKVSSCAFSNRTIILIYSLGYRPFMMLLQPQVCLLDKFVIQQEAIPNLMPIGLKPNHIVFNNNRAMENLEQITKNVSKQKYFSSRKKKHFYLINFSTFFPPI